MKKSPKRSSPKRSHAAESFSTEGLAGATIVEDLKNYLEDFDPLLRSTGKDFSVIYEDIGDPYLQIDFFNYGLYLPQNLDKLRVEDPKASTRFFESINLEEDDEVYLRVSLIANGLLTVAFICSNIYSNYPKDYETLYLCMFNATFGEIGLQMMPVRIKETIYGVYKWWKNSCYIDSLFIGLYLTQAGRIILNKILLADPQVEVDVEYPHPKKLRKGIQGAILSDLESLGKGEKTKCTDLRSYLYHLQPSLEKTGRWSYYNIYELYSALVELFPELNMRLPTFEKMTKEEEQLTRKYLGSPKKASYPRSTNMLMMSEYVMETDGIDWDKVRSPYLVFFNSGAPRITKFTQPGIEISKDPNTGEKVAITKTKDLDFDIEGGRYSLAFIVLLTNVGMKGGGTHYYSYLIDEIGNQYKYDDTEGLTKVDSIPNVFDETKRTIPSFAVYRLNYLRLDDVESTGMGHFRIPTHSTNVPGFGYTVTQHKLMYTLALRPSSKEMKTKIATLVEILKSQGMEIKNLTIKNLYERDLEKILSLLKTHVLQEDYYFPMNRYNTLVS